MFIKATSYLCCGTLWHLALNCWRVILWVVWFTRFLKKFLENESTVLENYASINQSGCVLQAFLPRLIMSVMVLKLRPKYGVSYHT